MESKESNKYLKRFMEISHDPSRPKTFNTIYWTITIANLSPAYCDVQLIVFSLMDFAQKGANLLRARTYSAFHIRSR